MKNIKLNDKTIMLYAIIEFILFSVSVILNVKELNTIGGVLLLVAITVSILFSLIACPKMMDKIILLSFNASIFLYELFVIIGIMLVAYIFLSLSLLLILFKIIFNNRNNKILVCISIGIFIALGVGLIFIYRLFTQDYFYIALDSASLLLAFGLSIYSFMSAKKEKKPNYFFFLVGLFFFILFRLSIVLNGEFNFEEPMSGLINLVMFSFFLPAALFSAIGFIDFELTQLSEK